MNAAPFVYHNTQAVQHPPIQETIHVTNLLRPFSHCGVFYNHDRKVPELPWNGYGLAVPAGGGSGVGIGYQGEFGPWIAQLMLEGKSVQYNPKPVIHQGNEALFALLVGVMPVAGYMQVVP